MNLYEYEYIVFLGRFQPCHTAHIDTIRTALKKAKTVIVLIGSANQPTTIKNPWTWEQRVQMMSMSLDPEEVSNIVFRPINDDAYNNQRWVTQVQKIVKSITKESKSVGIIGHTKDDTSFYLSMFPQWNHIEMPNINDLHATDIRTTLFDSDVPDLTNMLNKLPEGIHEYLRAWLHKPEYDTLRTEFEFIKKYKSSWSGAPYEPTFVTVDAVVIQSGHILLIKRKSSPGAGLYALPGGFVNTSESIEEAVFRELKEETKIKVPVPVLRGNIQNTHVFDSPNRSLRGRTITHAFHIELPPTSLPKVKGSSDAEKAKWIPLNTVYAMRDQLFEDHIDIITFFVGD